MTEYSKLIKNLEELDLIKIRSYLPEFLDKNKKESPKIIKQLNELIELENERADIIEESVFIFGFSLAMNLCMESKEDIS